MREEKAKELRENELDDSELDQVAGGAKFGRVSRECALCRTSLIIDDIVLKEINGVLKSLCPDCARKL